MIMARLVNKNEIPHGDDLIRESYPSIRRPEVVREERSSVSGDDILKCIGACLLIFAGAVGGPLFGIAIYAYCVFVCPPLILLFLAALAFGGPEFFDAYFLVTGGIGVLCSLPKVAEILD